VVVESENERAVVAAAAAKEEKNGSLCFGKFPFQGITNGNKSF
jgi:hypothetical protein